MGDESETRKGLLIDMLQEDNEDCPEPPEYAVKLWSEDDIRQYFETMSLDGLPAPSGAATLGPAEIAAKFPAPAQAEFDAWFPGLQRSGTKTDAPKLRLVCWTNAGNEENLYTNEGVGARKVSTLLDFCKANAVEVLAPQLPGRGARGKEPFIKTTQEVAEAVVKVIAHRLFSDGVPYCVIGHSVGTWNGFEFLSLLRDEGLPMPLKTFFSGFPSPDIPVDERPWVADNDTLDDPAFKDESRGWDTNEVVFSDGMWKMFGPLMRADFGLFDRYAFGRAADAPFDFPLTTFYATKDKKVKEKHVKGWERFTTKAFSISPIEGHHLYPMGLGDQKPGKIAWLEAIVKELGEFVA